MDDIHGSHSMDLMSWVTWHCDSHGMRSLFGSNSNAMLVAQGPVPEMEPQCSDAPPDPQPVEDDAESEGHGLFASMVERLAPATSLLEKHDDLPLQLLTLVAKDYTREQVRFAAREAGTKPTLLIYTSDMTPMLHRSRFQVQLGEQRERREHRKPVEWLLQRGYLVVPKDGGGHLAKILFSAPVEMRAKKIWDQYAVADRFLPDIRTWHADGVNLVWLSFDRGVLDPLSRVLRRRELFSLSKVQCPRERAREEAREWIFSCGCADQCRMLCAKGVPSGIRTSPGCISDSSGQFDLLGTRSTSSWKRCLSG